MLINCVAYRDGRKLADIGIEEISSYVSQPDTLVWVALAEPSDAEAPYTERTCIIVVEVAGAPGHVMMGIVVDAVSEVLNIRGADIENTPTFGVRLNTDFILGMAKAAGGIKIRLDIDKVLNSEDLTAIRHAA